MAKNKKTNLISQWTPIQKNQNKTQNKKDKKKKTILPSKDPGFEKFCRWLAIPQYAGLFKWQKEHHDLTWHSEYEMTLVPRDHGKSIGYIWKYQWAMHYHEYDVLLLGWTDRRKEAALYVYSFFYQNDLIDTDKRTSPFHFRTKTGAKFDCYLITSKETLGMHSEGAQNRFDGVTNKQLKEFKDLFRDDSGDLVLSEEELDSYIKSRKSSKRKLWISIDDPIDINFMKERHKEDTLELHFNSSLYPIHPAKWSFTGTHKFEGDFFDFIEEKFGEEIIKYKRGTRLGDGSLLCPERFTHPDLSTYKSDLKKGKRDLNKIRKHVGEYSWFAEYEQDPHPITGDVWDSVKTIHTLDSPLHRKYDICWITIDRATTRNKRSSFTGCLIGLRHMDTGHKVITHDWTDKIALENLLIKINNFVIDFKKKHEHIRIILVIEKQGGGDDFIEMARNRREFLFEGKRISNKISVLTEIIPLHNIGEKKQRIYDRLYLPIKNKLISMLSTLQYSEIWNEILKFPYYGKLDAIDALANVEFELTKIPITGQRDPFLEIGEAFKKMDALEDRPWERLTPEEKLKKTIERIRYNKRRIVMDDNW